MPFASTTVATAASGTIAARPLALNVRMPDGGWLAPPAEAGVRVMDLLARFGLPVRDECRGRCDCATCRARVAPDWRDRLPPPTIDEVARIAALADEEEGTRLLCGLVMTPDLDGLELQLHWDSLVPQTCWTAG